MRRIVVSLMAAHLLLCSVILPLGDFSLLNQLPRMYQAYQRVSPPKDQDVIDFVGDYLFGGKDLLGHNRHDRPDKDHAIQFHHAGVTAYVLQKQYPDVTRVHAAETTGYNVLYLPGKPSDYQNSLLRPPLA